MAEDKIMGEDGMVKIDLFPPDFQKRLEAIGGKDPTGLSDDALEDAIALHEGHVEGAFVALRIPTEDSSPEILMDTLDQGRAHMYVLMALVNELQRRFKQAGATPTA